MASQQDTCVPPKEVPVRSMTRHVDRPVDRLVGGESHCASARLKVSVTVVSDYLLIARGPPEPWGLQGLAQIASSERDFDQLLNNIKRRMTMTGELQVPTVKRMYKCGGIPCIPGSTVKGAVRSRIELGAYGAGGEVLAEIKDPPLQVLPQPGRHGWRHARVWCESVFESRPSVIVSKLEDLFGSAGKEIALASRVFFSDMVADSFDTRLLVLDHNETVEAVVSGSTFKGEVVLANASLEDLGLVLYGFGLDKSYLCNGVPKLLVGASKYRCRRVFRLCREQERKLSCSEAYGKPATFGIVEVKLEGIEYAPWSRCRWDNNVDTIAIKALKAAINAYPELRTCFDEVERRLLVEPCR